VSDAVPAAVSGAATAPEGRAMSLTASPQVGVVLLNYGGSADTLACLDSLLAQQRLPARVVIVDNHSPGGDLQRLRQGLGARSAALEAAAARSPLPAAQAWAEGRRDALEATPAAPRAWLSLVDNGENGGFAAGNNTGLRLLLREPALTHAWLLNNDTLVPEDCLAALLAAAAARPAVGLWGATVLDAHAAGGRVQALGGGGMRPRTAETFHLGAFEGRASVPRTPEAVADIESRMAYVLGASLFATRAWLERVGLLAEDYFLYYEELDWAWRGRRHGLALGYAPAAVVHHKEGATIGTAPEGGSALSVYHLHRSRMIFCRKHLGLGVLVGSAAAALRDAVRHGLRGRGRLVLPLLRGTWAGLRAPRAAA
jgi:GT2 family glycosyltransferase